MTKLKRILTALMLTSLLVGALPSVGVAQDGNLDCPPGTVLIAKFEWNDIDDYVFEKGYLNIVDITGDETGGDWTSLVEILYVIIKGAQKTVTYEVTYDFNPAEFAGAFSQDDFTPDDNDPAISNIQFCGPPSTAITLVSFTAAGSAGGVTLTWETGTEVDNAGFNLYRATSADGPWAKINGALIAAKGDPVSGASYSFLDAPGFGTFFYRLEDVDYYGFSTFHGPVNVTLKSPFRSPNYRPTPPG